MPEPDGQPDVLSRSVDELQRRALNDWRLDEMLERRPELGWSCTTDGHVRLELEGGACLICGAPLPSTA